MTRFFILATLLLIVSNLLCAKSTWSNPSKVEGLKLIELDRVKPESSLVQVNIKGADSKGNVFEKRILTKKQGNKLMFEGDILIETLSLELEQQLMTAQGIVHSSSSRRWPNGIVPYEIDSVSFSTEQVSRIQEAMQTIEDITGVEFIQRSTEVNYVYIEADDGCYSSVGMAGGMQVLSLGEGCFYGATPEHEFYHALGVWHEQSRADREQYIQIRFENITEGMSYNFDQHITDGEDIGTYDYLSIMHYDNYAFSANNEPTIVRLDDPSLPLGGEEITQGDRETLQAMYGDPSDDYLQLEEAMWVEYIPAADDPDIQGFVRFTNPSASSVRVLIQGIDDYGNYSQQAYLTVPAYATVPVNSTDLENGNVSKGLEGSLGDGQGDWRIELFSESKLDVSAYIRTNNGFLTSMNSIAPSQTGVTHTVPIFNPASNTSKVSVLRLINISSNPNTFTISGIDDAGNDSARQVSVTVNGLSTIEITAQELENGGDLIETGIGSGSGKWRLTVTSEFASRIINLMTLDGGYLSNLSAVGNGKNLATRLYCTDISGASIFSDEEEPQYLGFFGSALAEHSVMNGDTHWGATYGYNNIVNTDSVYGNQSSNFSHRNNSASNPPLVVKNGRIIFRLSTNSNIDGIYSFDGIKGACNFTATKPSSRFE